MKTNPRQIQIFTPTPSTFSTLMYFTEKDFKTNKKLFVEKNNRSKEKQKAVMFSSKTAPRWKREFKTSS